MDYATHYWYEADVVSGNPFNPLASSVDANQPDNFYMYHSPSAQGDVSELAVRLEPGDYRMSFLGTQSPTGAIQTVYLDGVLAATFDRYDAVSLEAIFYQTTVTVVNPVSVVSSRTESRNGLSSGWDVYNTRIWFDKNGI